MSTEQGYCHIKDFYCDAPNSYPSESYVTNRHGPDAHVQSRRQSVPDHSCRLLHKICRNDGTTKQKGYNSRFMAI